MNSKLISETRQIIIDGIRVDYLLTSKGNHTFFRMVDGSIKTVKTIEYDNTLGKKGLITLCSN